MWIVHLALSLATLYAATITGMFFAQTWLLFPTILAGAVRAQLPASTQRLEVRTPDGESLAGVQILGKAQCAPTLLGFGGDAWNAEIMALTLHRLFGFEGVTAGSGRSSNGSPFAMRRTHSADRSQGCGVALTNIKDVRWSGW